MKPNIQKITLANGCFWCTEAIFQSLTGVVKVDSGYMGGTIKNPTYMEICNGKTGHTEVVDLDFDADIISFDELLWIFFKTHNPTLINKQGNDAGTQYRSAIFYHTEEQRQQAVAMIKKLTDWQVFDKPIVTQVEAAGIFYKAEEHHQNYYVSNPLKLYCTTVIQPKLHTLAKEFTDKIKPELL